MKSRKPTSKVAAAAVGGTLASLIVGLGSLVGLPIPLEVAGYMEGAVLTALTAAYQKAEKA